MSKIIKELSKYFTDVYIEPNYTTEEWIVEVSYFDYLAEVKVKAGQLKPKALLGRLRAAVDDIEQQQRAKPAVALLECDGEQYCFEF